MKRFITLLLTLALVFGAVLASFNVNVYADEADTYNYFDMSTISPIPVAPCKGTRVYRTSVDGKSAYAVTGINYRYNSLGFDILPAVKAALGDKYYARVTISFQIKVVWTDEFAGHTATCKPILRCMAPQGAVYNATSWNTEYKNSLVGSEAIFSDSDGKNIIGNVSNKRVLLNDDVWVTFSTDMLVDRQQVYNYMTPDWTFCFDEMNGAHQPTEKETDSLGQLKIFDQVIIKDVSVCLSVNQSTPTPKATAKPTEKPTAKPTTNTDATATAEATQATNNDSDNKDFDRSIIIYTVIGAVAGAAISYVCFVRKNKNTNGKSKSNSDDVFPVD